MPSPFSIRHRIMAEVLTRFTTILTANGYKTQLGANTQQWRLKAWEDSELPAMSIHDPENTTIEENAASQTHQLRVICEVFVAPGATGVEGIYDLIMDVWKATGVDRRWTDSQTVQLAMNTRQIKDTITMDEQGKKIMGAILEFHIEYRTKPFDPDDLA